MAFWRLFLNTSLFNFKLRGNFWVTQRKNWATFHSNVRSHCSHTLKRSPHTHPLATKVNFSKGCVVTKNAPNFPSSNRERGEKRGRERGWVCVGRKQQTTFLLSASKATSSGRFLSINVLPHLIHRPHQQLPCAAQNVAILTSFCYHYWMLFTTIAVKQFSIIWLLYLSTFVLNKIINLSQNKNNFAQF